MIGGIGATHSCTQGTLWGALYMGLGSGWSEQLHSDGGGKVRISRLTRGDCTRRQRHKHNARETRGPHKRCSKHTERYNALVISGAYRKNKNSHWPRQERAARAGRRRAGARGSGAAKSRAAESSSSAGGDAGGGDDWQTVSR